MRGGRSWVVFVSVVLMWGLVLGATGCGAPAAAPTKPAAQVQPTAPAKPAEQPTAATKAGEPFKIGMFIALTGTAAAAGTDMRDGIRLFLEEKGSVLAGHPVELLVEDTTGDPATAVTKARKLIEKDGANVLFGPLFASEAYAAAEYATQNKVTLWLPVPSSDDLTQRLKSDYVLRTGWTSSQPSYAFADYVYNKLGYRKLAAMGMDYAFGYEVVGGFQYRFQELGGKVVKKIWTAIGVPDFGPYLAQLPTDVDALFALYGAGDATKFIPAYRDYGLKGKLPVIGGGVLTDESILQKLGDDAIGIIDPLHYSAALQTPENLAFTKAFQAKYARGASYYAENSYSAGMAMEAVLKAVGADYKDPLKFAQAFKQIKFVAPRGPIQVDEYNHVIQNIYIRKVEKVGGQLQNTVIETIPNVSQFGPYPPKEYLARPIYSRDYPAPKP